MCYVRYESQPFQHRIYRVSFSRDLFLWCDNMQSSEGEFFILIVLKFFDKKEMNERSNTRTNERTKERMNI